MADRPTKMTDALGRGGYRVKTGRDTLAAKAASAPATSRQPAHSGKSYDQIVDEAVNGPTDEDFKRQRSDHHNE